MLAQSVRLVAAVITFTISIALVRMLELIPHFETALADRFVVVNEKDLAPVCLVDPAVDANEIYRLLIQKKFTSDREVELIVLQAETAAFDIDEFEFSRMHWGVFQTFHQYINEIMPETQPQTLDNYLARNMTSEELKVVELGPYYVLFNKSELQDEGLEDFWTEFYRRYPNSYGLIFFSNVGFNVQRDQAFVYAGEICGGLCGSGQYVLLSKVNGKWEIQNETVLWVS